MMLATQQSHIKCIALLEHRAVAYVRRRIVVDEVSSFLRLAMKLVLALSCCKNKQKKKILLMYYRAFYFVDVLSTAAVTGCLGGCRLSMR
jgi:hypothetical protein